MKYLNKTIEYGLYLLVFFLPVQTRWIIKAGELNNGPWEYGSYSLYGTDILLIFILFLFIIYRFLERRNLKFKILNFLIFGLVLASAASILAAADRWLALYKFGWLIAGVGLFWLISQASFNRAKLIWSLLAGLTFQAGLGVWQFLFQSSFENKWLGLAGHQSAELGASVVETIGPDGVGERWLRAYGGLDHPNILGGMLAIGILFLLGEMIRAGQVNDFPRFAKSGLPARLTCATAKPGQIIFNLIRWLWLVIFAAALFFSFSRAAWLALAVGLALMAAGLIVKKDFKAQKLLAQAIIILGVSWFIMFSLYANLVITRLYSSDRLEVKSAGERLESLENSWPVIKDHWAGGAGLGNYGLALRDKLARPEPSYFYQPAHNVFILVFSETGIFGIMLFLGLIVYLIMTNFQFPISNKISNIKCQMSNQKLEIRNWKLEIRENDKAKDAIVRLSVLIALIVLMSLDHWLWSLHGGALFFWLAMGLMAGNPPVRGSEPF